MSAPAAPPRGARIPGGHPAPARGGSTHGATRITLGWIAAAALAAALFAGSHALTGSQPRASAPPANPDALIHGARLQSARCSNWLAATPAERALAVGALAATVGAPTEYRGVRGTALTEPESFQLLNNACSSLIARNFLLYELYIRAAGFRSLWAQP